MYISKLLHKFNPNINNGLLFALSDIEQLVFIGKQGGNVTLQVQKISGNLHQLLAEPECVPALFEIIKTNPHWQVRQFVGLELRKAFNRHYSKLDGFIATFKQQSLDHVLKEESAKARDSFARVIVTVASKELQGGRWPEWNQFLQFCVNHEQGSFRELILLILHETFEESPEVFQGSEQVVLSMFINGLRDKEPSVRMYSVFGISAVSNVISAQDKALVECIRDSVPEIMTVIQYYLGDEDASVKLISALDYMIEAESCVLNKHLALIIQFFATVAQNRDISSEIRLMAINFMDYALVYKKNRIVKEKLTETIISSLMPLLTEELDIDDPDEDSPPRSVLTLIHSFSTSLPPSHTFQLVMKNVIQLLNGDSNSRTGALMAVAYLIEGCSDNFRSNLNETMQLLCNGLCDNEITVKKAACFALSHLIEFLEEEVSVFHAQLFPLLCPLLSSDDFVLQKYACVALDFLMDHVGDDIHAYANQVMEILLKLITQTSIDNKATVMGTIGTIASSCGSSFSPYFARLVPFLIECAKLDSMEMLSLRSMTMETTSNICVAVGAEMFSPYLQVFMECSITGLGIDNNSLRECTYMFYTKISSVFKNSFAPYLPLVVPELFKSLTLPEETLIEDDDDDSTELIQVNSSIIEEKEAAMHTLSLLFEYMPMAFKPYLDETISAAKQLLHHSHENIRIECFSSLCRILTAMYSSMGLPNWTAGNADPVADDQFMQLLKYIVDISIRIFENETDRSTVAQMCLDMSNTIKSIGPLMIQNCHEALVNHLLKLFENKAKCQDDEDEDCDALGEQEQTEGEAFLIETVVDLTSSLCQVMGPMFLGYFKIFLPHVLKYYGPDRPVPDRSMAIGSLGEMVGSLQEKSTEFAPTVFPVVMAALSDKDDEVRSNATFAMGQLCLYTAMDQVKSYYPSILAAIHPFFSQKKRSNITDNACGCLCRMITAHPDSVPLVEAFTILFDSLPLRRDNEEYVPIIQCLAKVADKLGDFKVKAVNLVMLLIESIAKGDKHNPLTRPALVHLIKVLGVNSFEQQEKIQWILQ